MLVMSLKYIPVTQSSLCLIFFMYTATMHCLNYGGQSSKEQFAVISWLVSWYFEPGQSQRITSWLKTMFNLSPIYFARKSSNHKLFKNHKISPVHKFTYNKTYTNIEHIIFKELVPLVSPLLKKHIRLGHAGIVDHSVDLSIPDF